YFYSSRAQGLEAIGVHWVPIHFQCMALMLHGFSSFVGWVHVTLWVDWGLGIHYCHLPVMEEFCRE
ncbi:MAG: hypothetical protein M0036_26170, partial [Desulfobacteraceae bacterium]|nr:hypothetical protein [Desulfobacteraceae bacterium]